MPTEQEIAKQKAEAEAAEKADSEAAEKALKEIDEIAEKGGTIEKDEFVKVKKSQLFKVASDKNNYKKIGLDKKAAERNLDGKGKDGDGKGKDGDGGGAMIDEAKISEIAKKHATESMGEIYKSNEARAKREFLRRHGELMDDSAWTGFISHFTSKHGKATVEDIMDDMEDAMLLYKRNTGKLDEYMKSEAERARQEGRIQGQMDQGRDAGGAGDRNEKGKGSGSLSQKGEEMANHMHVDVEKAKKVEFSKDNVIDVTK